MKFLGLAAEYGLRRAFGHCWAMGGVKDFENFRRFLEKKYGGRVGLYANGRTALAAGLITGMAEKLGLEVGQRLGREELLRLKKEIEKKLGRKPRVGVNGLTCYAVVQGVREAGCEVIFLDLEKEEVNFGVEELRGRELEAVIVQHNLGQVVRMRELVEVVERRGILLVEDLAHATGLKDEEGKEVGSFGEVVVLSFGKGKAGDVCGGGAVIVKGDGGKLIQKRGESWGVNLKNRIYPLIGWKTRKLMGLRMELGKVYLGLCVKLKLVERSAEGGVNFDKRLSYWQAKLLMRKVSRGEFLLKKPLRKWYLVREREQVLAELEQAGFYGPDFWYEKPVAPERYFEKSGYKIGECVEAEWVAERIVNLPGSSKRKDLLKWEKIIKKYEVRRDDE